MILKILKVTRFFFHFYGIDGNLACGGRGWEGGGLLYEKVGGMPFVSLRGERILVSLGVFEAYRHYFELSKYRLGCFYNGSISSPIYSPGLLP